MCVRREAKVNDNSFLGKTLAVQLRARESVTPSAAPPVMRICDDCGLRCEVTGLPNTAWSLLLVLARGLNFTPYRL